MQAESDLTILDAAVDWLTVTAKRGLRADSLIARASACLHQAESAGNRVSPFRASGYHGWRSEGIVWGLRKDGAIASISSGAAALHWSSFLEDSDNVTRVDLQITCADSTVNASRAEIAYHLMQDNRKRAGRPISASLRLNSSGGQTLYLGSKQSDVMGRLYDKGIEKKFAQAGACWRYETQLRREPAERTIRTISQSETVHDCIAGLVTTFFSARGVAVPQVIQLDTGNNPTREGYYLSKRETDDTRSLRWLGTYVASTVKRLVDSGKRSEVMSALGLNDKLDDDIERL
jgi:DNA relaxase NicK